MDVRLELISKGNWEGGGGVDGIKLANYQQNIKNFPALFPQYMLTI